MSNASTPKRKRATSHKPKDYRYSYEEYLKHFTPPESDDDSPEHGAEQSTDQVSEQIVRAVLKELQSQ